MRSVSTIAEIDIAAQSRVLVFMPHPDDEAVFISGLLQKLTKNNIPVRVITLTAGEKSTLRYGLKPTDDLATVRKAELANAFALLGVTDFEICNFPDGGLEMADIQKKIQAEITTYKPTHLITLEPDGIYGHPDHIAVSLAVTKAYPKSVKLVYATVSPHYTLPSAKHMAKKAVIKPIHPQYKLRLTCRESINKIKALKAHRSQFKIDFINPKTILFFLLNDMLLHEYCSCKKEIIT